MSTSWDERVVPSEQREFVRRIQRVEACRLAGGAVLSGVHLRHRLSRDLDLFCDEREAVRSALRGAQEAAQAMGGQLQLVRDGGTFVRSTLTLGGRRFELDIAHEPSEALAPRDRVEDVLVDSLEDLRANKLTCLLSRSEPRDLVDLYFLDRAQLPPEASLEAALRKDAGIDPGVLSLLLLEFPTAPLPQLLRDLSESELREFRSELARRFKAAAVPPRAET